MANALHSRQTVTEGIHIIHAFEYADAAARTGATGLAADDEGKVARQLDNDTWWLLTDSTGPTWSQLAQSTGVPTSRNLTAGSGLTGGGDLSADRTFNVAANADGSITVNADDVQVGVLASDTQHGTRGGGTQHAAVTTSVAGFMSATDKTKLDGIEAGAKADHAGLSNVTANQHHNQQHGLGSSDHTSATLAQLNALISDATLDSSSASRPPTSHASSHQPGGGDAMAVDAAAGTGSLRTLGTGAAQACAGSDSRLSDDRTASGIRTASTIVVVSGATAPTTGQVLKALSSTAATWQDETGGTSPYVADGSSEGESSTTSGTYQQKLRVTTPSLTSGVRYKIEYQFETGVTADSDIAFRVQLDNTTTICEGVFKNHPYATRYEIQSGFYFSTTLSGVVDIDVDYYLGYGSTAYIRRARILVTRVD
jgi:hypothetical protein